MDDNNLDGDDDSQKDVLARYEQNRGHLTFPLPERVSYYSSDATRERDRGTSLRRKSVVPRVARQQPLVVVYQQFRNTMMDKRFADDAEGHSLYKPALMTLKDLAPPASEYAAKDIGGLIRVIKACEHIRTMRNLDDFVRNMKGFESKLSYAVEIMREKAAPAKQTAELERILTAYKESGLASVIKLRKIEGAVPAAAK